MKTSFLLLLFSSFFSSFTNAGNLRSASFPELPNRNDAPTFNAFQQIADQSERDLIGFPDIEAATDLVVNFLCLIIEITVDVAGTRCYCNLDSSHEVSSHFEFACNSPFAAGELQTTVTILPYFLFSSVRVCVNDPTVKLIGPHIQFPDACISYSFSPVGPVVATAVNQILGITDSVENVVLDFFGEDLPDLITGIVNQFGENTLIDEIVLGTVETVTDFLQGNITDVVEDLLGDAIDIFNSTNATTLVEGTIGLVSEILNLTAAEVFDEVITIIGDGLEAGNITAGDAVDAIAGVFNQTAEGLIDQVNSTLIAITDEIIPGVVDAIESSAEQVIGQCSAEVGGSLCGCTPCAGDGVRVGCDIGAIFGRDLESGCVRVPDIEETAVAQTIISLLDDGRQLLPNFGFF